MNEKQAHEIMRNLTRIHRCIHTGVIDNIQPKNDPYGFFCDNIDNFIFYYQVFSSYAMDLDVYINYVINPRYPEIENINAFDKHVREALEEMIHYIEIYNIDLEIKKRFIERSSIEEVFEILNIEKKDVLKRIKTYHEQNEVKTPNEYLSRYDLEINNLENEIKANSDNKNIKENKELKMQAVKNLKKMALSETYGKGISSITSYSRQTAMPHKLNPLDRGISDGIYNLAVKQAMLQIKNYEKFQKRQRKKYFLKQLKNKIKK